MDNKVRLIIERHEQPPFDTKARITHHYAVIIAEDLRSLLMSDNDHVSYRVIGAVPESKD